MQTTFYILYVMHPVVNSNGEVFEEKEIFYVGRTCGSLAARLSGHIKNGKRKRTPKGKYIAELLALNLEIQIEAVACSQSVELDIVAKTETLLIQQYTAQGCNLHNSRDGRCGSVYGKMTRVEWSEDIVALLGTVPDSAIAKLLNCSSSLVSLKRLQLNIPPYSVELWTEKALSQLGKIPDIKIAKKFGISPAAVLKKRRKLQIEPFVFDPWIPEAVSMLGQVPDIYIAEMIGVTESTVFNKRQELNIRSCRSQKTPEWTDELMNLLGKESDNALSKRFGIPKSIIAKKRNELNIPPSKIFVWTNEQINILGTMSDRKAAKTIGCSVNLVRAKREELNVPPGGKSGRPSTKP